MKKILKIAEVNHYRIVCHICGSHFSYEDEDIELLPAGVGSTHPFARFVECPKCRALLNHTDSYPSNIETMSL